MCRSPRLGEPAQRLTAILHREEEVVVAECPEVGTVSQGDTVEEALANLREATELFLEECPQPVLVPRLPAAEVVAALKRLGFEEVRQKGSHLVLRRTSTIETLLPITPVLQPA
jgi:predicted RNA binding protein YcfA (HicA-like mRNA interferase family)